MGFGQHVEDTILYHCFPQQAEFIRLPHPPPELSPDWHLTKSLSKETDDPAIYFWLNDKLSFHMDLKQFHLNIIPPTPVNSSLREDWIQPVFLVIFSISSSGKDNKKSISLLSLWCISKPFFPK